MGFVTPSLTFCEPARCSNVPVGVANPTRKTGAGLTFQHWPNMALNRSAVIMRFYFQLSVPRPVSFTLYTAQMEGNRYD